MNFSLLFLYPEGWQASPYCEQRPTLLGMLQRQTGCAQSKANCSLTPYQGFSSTRMSRTWRRGSRGLRSCAKSPGGLWVVTCEG